MAIRPAVSYIRCATYFREQTVDIIKFTQFEEGNLSSQTCDNAESVNEYGDD